MAAAYIPRAALAAPYAWQDDRFTGVFAGDIIGRDSVPWPLLLEAARGGRFDLCREFDGRFGFCLHDAAQGRTLLVSDRRSQLPLFYAADGGTLAFATSLAFFSRLPGERRIDPAWVHESLFFGSPLGSTTALTGVRRMPPATVLSWGPDAQVALTEYAPRFRRAPRILRGRAALDACREVLADRVPRYFSPDRRNGIALTSGLDSRVLAAFAPETGHDIQTYTYGVPGCRDLTGAADVSRRIGMKHRSVHFDEAFLRALPELIHRTIWLNDGLVGIQRAAMPYVYRRLSQEPGGPEVAITGVHGDAVLRGSGGVPMVIPPSFGAVWKTGAIDPGDRSRLDGACREPAGFWQSVENRIEWIRSTYGPLDDGATHLAFFVYEFPSVRHFEGEARIADHHLTYRAPYWDQKVLEYAFGSEFSTISLCTFLPGHVHPLDKNRAQCHAMLARPRMARIPLKGMPIATYARRSKSEFLVRRAVHSLARRMSSPEPALEDWKNWIRDPLGPEVDRILGRELRLESHLRPEFIRDVHARGDRYWIRRLISMELTLRLLENGWKVESAALQPDPA